MAPVRHMHDAYFGSATPPRVLPRSVLPYVLFSKEKIPEVYSIGLDWKYFGHGGQQSSCPAWGVRKDPLEYSCF
eukprot:jgi/Psemu1/301427/fgenesh1_kg.34_\